MLFGFQSDARSLEHVPAVAQVCPWSLSWGLAALLAAGEQPGPSGAGLHAAPHASILCRGVLQAAPAFLQSLKTLVAMRQPQPQQQQQQQRPPGPLRPSQLHAMLDRAVIKLAKSLRDTLEARHKPCLSDPALHAVLCLSAQCPMRSIYTIPPSGALGKCA